MSSRLGEARPAKTKLLILPRKVYYPQQGAERVRSRIKNSALTLSSFDATAIQTELMRICPELSTWATPLYNLYSNVRRQRVWFLSRFDLGIDGLRF